jgi:hypothetical protein
LRASDVEEDGAGDVRHRVNRVWQRKSLAVAAELAPVLASAQSAYVKQVVVALGVMSPITASSATASPHTSTAPADSIPLPGGVDDPRAHGVRKATR